MCNTRRNGAMKLPRSPIIEAVLDIDCDMPSKFDLSSLEPQLRDSLRAKYPKFRKQLFEQHRFESKPDSLPAHSATKGVQALQFLTEDERQVVQFRSQGFSFNRLEPYSTLDHYIDEIRSGWEIFLKVAAPSQIRAVRLRNINRILLPLMNGRVEAENYLKNIPGVADQKLVLVGFFVQYGAIEKESGFTTNVVIAAQPVENDKAPIILDITAQWAGRAIVENWPWLLEQVMSLRSLKNRVFSNSLTPQCLNLFQ